jgi:hypothetical protein
MRFRFFQPTSEVETGHHLAALERMNEFWSAGRGVLSRASRSALDLSRLEAALNDAAVRVDPGLVVELDRTPGGELVMVLAPKEDPGLDPLILELVRRAPRSGGVVVGRHWPAAPARAVLDRVGRRFDLDLSDCQVRAGFSRGHLLELVVYSSAFAGSIDGPGLDAANFAVSRVLGDRVFDDWVGAVDISPVPRTSSLRVVASENATGERFAFAELPTAIEKAIGGVRQGLPSVPYHEFCERGEWTLLELEPELGRDYSSLDDLALCATLVPEMTKCHLQGTRFCSERFSNNGELFCYLKVDGAGSTDEQRFDKRLALEEALNRALVPGCVGCVVGAGLGLRYVYLVLALARVDAGIQIARQVAQTADVPSRSWILFCDTTLRREWVSVWDHAPEPP